MFTAYLIKRTNYKTNKEIYDIYSEPRPTSMDALHEYDELIDQCDANTFGNAYNTLYSKYIDKCPIGQGYLDINKNTYESCIIL